MVLALGTFNICKQNYLSQLPQRRESNARLKMLLVLPVPDSNFPLTLFNIIFIVFLFSKKYLLKKKKKKQTNKQRFNQSQNLPQPSSSQRMINLIYLNCTMRGHFNMNINWFRLFAYKSGSSTLQKKKKSGSSKPPQEVL